MTAYQKVRSTLELSKSIAFYFEMSDPGGYPPSERARSVFAINDILQGRQNQTVDSLLAELREKGGSYYAGEIDSIQREIQAFQTQKALLSQPYTKHSDKQYQYRTFDLDPEHPLKIINQRLFDWAAKRGFPSDFFESSYFDHVALYCMPDGVRCCDSRFQDCQFIVCRLADVEFWDASLYSCEFHSCLLQGTIFADSTLAHTHFHDCDMPGSAFIRTRLKNCNTMDCTIGNLNLANAILDGASYSRITRLPGSKTRHLDTATITMGGATDEEVETLKHSIFKALQVPEQPQVRPRRTKPHRGDAR